MKPTTVKASYKNKSFSSEPFPADIPELLRSMSDIHVGDAKRYVIRWLTGPANAYQARHMTAVLLWLACNGDQGEHAKAEALKGGATIEYQLTDADDAVGCHYLTLLVHESQPSGRASAALR